MTKTRATHGDQLKQIYKTSPLAKSPQQRLNERLAEPVAPLKEQKKGLSPKEWRFVQEFVSNDGQITLKEACVRAGYNEAEAYVVGSVLTNPKKNPQVVAAIQQYRAELAEKYGTNFERHMRDLQIIRDKAIEAGNFGAAVAAEYRRGQALGTIYIERKEIRVGTIDSMSKEEVRRKLEEIKALYGPPPEFLGMELEEEPKGMLELMRDAEKTRRTTVQEIEAEFTEIDDSADREPGGTGSSGLPDSDASGPLRDDRAEGGSDGEEGAAKPAPDSVRTEPCDGGDADVHSN